MTCNHYQNNRCTHTDANQAYGETPSPGVCQVCTWYEGPERPPLVQVSAPVSVPKPPAMKRKPRILEKVSSYLKAEASMLVSGPVGVDEYEARISACMECKHLKPLVEDGKIGWCGACGCGTSKRAELTTKARMPRAKCPVGAWPSKEN